MNRKTATTFLTAGIFSLIALVDAGLVLADQRGRHDQSRRESARREINQNRREIQKDRADLHKDVREYNRDREALQRAYRRGASRSEIERLRNEARQSGREVAESRQELAGIIANFAATSIAMVTRTVVWATTEVARIPIIAVGGVGATAPGITIGTAVDWVTAGTEI